MTTGRRGVCLVVAAPSGAGKSSIVHALLDRDPELTLSVSITTRNPRVGEVDGVQYHFRNPAQFTAMVADDALLEHAMVFGRGYGTPRAAVESRLVAGCDVVLDIDWQGWRQVRARLPGDCVSVFILPPSLVVLEERLRGRATDADAEVRRRMDAARGEIAHWAEFDHLVVNDRLDACVEEVACVLRAARCTRARSLAAAALAEAMLSG